MGQRFTFAGGSILEVDSGGGCCNDAHVLDITAL